MSDVCATVLSGINSERRTRAGAGVKKRRRRRCRCRRLQQTRIAQVLYAHFAIENGIYTIHMWLVFYTYVHESSVERVRNAQSFYRGCCTSCVSVGLSVCISRQAECKTFFIYWFVFPNSKLRDRHRIFTIIPSHWLYDLYVCNVRNADN